MTPITATIAIRVVRPEITISVRARLTKRAAMGSRGSSSSGSGLLMAHDQRLDIVVADADAGGRLDRVLATRIADLSRSRLKALILAGEVAIGGRTIRDPSERVNVGEVITVGVPPAEAPVPRAEP